MTTCVKNISEKQVT